MSKGIDLTDIVEKASFVDINSGHECVNCVDPPTCMLLSQLILTLGGTSCPPSPSF